MIGRLLRLASTAVALTAGTTAHSTDRLTLQLMWVTQTQFAGYYVAKDKGFYKDVNLDVTVKAGAPEISTENTIAAGNADVIVDWLALALAARDRGVAPLLNISQIFQGSSFLLVCLKASGVTSLADLPGHSVGVWFFGREFIFLHWMAKLNISTQGGPHGVTMVLQQSGPDLLANRQTACVSALSYNEYWQLIEAGFRPNDLVVFKSSDADAATLEDGVYVNGDRLKDAAFVDRVARFVAASLRGWAWAIEHRDEAIQMVLANDATRTQTNEHQKTMMNEVAKLISESGSPLGYLNPADYDHTVSLLLSQGVIHKRPEVSWTHAIYEASMKYWDRAR